jgi:hypothetical protein
MANMPGNVGLPPGARHVNGLPWLEQSQDAATGGGFFGRGGWVERNGQMVGGIVQGAAGGLLQGMAAGDAAKADEEAALRRSGNYRTTRGLMTGAPQQGQAAPPNASVPNGHPTMAEKYDPVRTPVRFRYNPETGEIERQALA